jgi:hypothetical protein
LPRHVAADFENEMELFSPGYLDSQVGARDFKNRPLDGVKQQTFYKKISKFFQNCIPNHEIVSYNEYKKGIRIKKIYI